MFASFDGARRHLNLEMNEVVEELSLVANEYKKTGMISNIHDLIKKVDTVARTAGMMNCMYDDEVEADMTDLCDKFKVAVFDDDMGVEYI